jgi:hypothetical protein
MRCSIDPRRELLGQPGECNAQRLRRSRCSGFHFSSVAMGADAQMLLEGPAHTLLTAKTGCFGDALDRLSGSLE